MKKIYIIIFLIISVFSVFAQNTELFNFPICDGKRNLNGTLTIPLNFKEGMPIAILVSPPQATERDYYGLFLNISEKLVQNNIATLRYDNRNFSDSLLEKDDDRYSIFDIAEDAHYAYLAIKKDEKLRTGKAFDFLCKMMSDWIKKNINK